MKYLSKISICLILLLVSVFSFANERVAYVEINTEFAVVVGMETKIQLVALDSLGKPVKINCFSSAYVDNEKIDLYFVDGTAEFKYVFDEFKTVKVECDTISATKDVNPIPLWFSIIPPLIAILFALLIKEVFSALFLGLLSGTFIVFLYSGVNAFSAFFKAMFAIVDT